MFGKLKDICIQSFAQIEKHQKESKADITKGNITLLMSISFCGIVIIGLLLIIAPLIVQPWHVTIAHWLVLACFAVYFIISIYEYKYKMNSYQCVHITTLTFISIIMVLVMVLNIVAYPDHVAALVPIAMVALPIMFILPFHEILIFLVLSFLVFLQINNAYSDETVLNENLFNTIAGVVIGIGVSFISVNLRAQDNRDRQEIVRTSKEDQLTGIWNKSAVEKKCFTFLEHCEEENCALIAIDIDDFKSINDSLGHHAGDEVLATFGNCLKQVFRSTDILGRIGGDEFIVLMKYVNEASVVEVKMNKLTELFHDIVKEKFNMDATCSYGAILKINENIPYLPLFNMADKILYKSKKNGKAQGETLDINGFYKLVSSKPIMLITEDNAINRSALRTIFEDDYEILEAVDGQEAKGVIEKHHSIIDIMLLDIIMPNVDGIQVLTWMRETGYLKTLPVIAVSADEESELETLELGVSDMISKPFDSKVLKRRVQNVIRHI